MIMAPKLITKSCSGTNDERNERNRLKEVLRVDGRFKMTKTTVVHADSCFGQDVTLCGVGFEELEVGGCVDDSASGDTVATLNEKITCKDCLALIRWCKQFRGNRQP